MANALNIAIPAIGLEFGSDQRLLNWTVSGFFLASAAFLLPFGRLADQLGRKKIFLIGSIFLAVTSLACALSPSLPALVVFRTLQGIGSSMIFSTSMAILTSVVPPESRGRVLGINAAATYVGLSCGPVLGGFITRVFTWRGVFWFNLLLSLAVVLLTVWRLKGEWRGAPSKLDPGGSILCVTSQVLLLFGLSNLASGPLYLISFIVGAILLVAFFIFESKQENPLIPVSYIVKNKTFAFSNLATLINYSATFALSFMMSLYLQAALELEAATAGLILLVQPVVMAVLSPVTGALSDKIRPGILASAGMGVSALSLFLFIFLTPRTPVALIILNLLLIGFGFALFASPNSNAVMGSIDPSLYGLASSLMGNMRLLGQSLSMAIISLITSVLMGSLKIGMDGYVGQLMASLRAAFIIFAALCILGVFASLARGTSKREEAL